MAICLDAAILPPLVLSVALACDASRDGVASDAGAGASSSSPDAAVFVAQAPDASGPVGHPPLPTPAAGDADAWLAACQGCAQGTNACSDEGCLRCIYADPPFSLPGCEPTAFQIESFGILNAECREECR